MYTETSSCTPANGCPQNQGSLPGENRSIYWDDVAMFCHPDEYQFGVYPISAEDLREIDSFTELCEADSSYRGRVN